MISPKYVEDILQERFRQKMQENNVEIHIATSLRSPKECVLINAKRENQQRFDNVNMSYDIVVSIDYEHPHSENNRERIENIEEIISNQVLFDDCWLVARIEGFVGSSLVTIDELWNEENKKYNSNRVLTINIIGR